MEESSKALLFVGEIMNSNFDDLRKLRESAPAGKWMERNAPLMRLLNAIGSVETLDIAIQTVDNYLPNFEQAHQVEKWVYNSMHFIRECATSGGLDRLRANPIPVDHADRYSKRLAFIIAELRYGFLNLDDATKAIESAIEVISRTFMFEIGDRMNTISPKPARPSTNNPVEIQKFMNDGVMEGIHLRNHPEVAKLEISLWLGLADEIEKRLNPKST